MNFWPFKPRIGEEALNIIESLLRDAVRFHVPKGFGEPQVYTDIGAMVTIVPFTTESLITSPAFEFNKAERNAICAAYRNAVMRAQLKITKGEQ